jgi:hypothetical protein
LLNALQDNSIFIDDIENENLKHLLKTYSDKGIVNHVKEVEKKEDENQSYTTYVGVPYQSPNTNLRNLTRIQKKKTQLCR